MMKKFAIIGAGVVVNKDVLDYVFMGGVLSKYLGWRATESVYCG